MPTLRIYGVIPPIVTPFTENGDLDEQAFTFNLGRWNQEDLGGYVVLGSNSEAPYLAEEEKLRLIERTAQHSKGGRVIIAGTGLESTRNTIRLTNLAAAAGAHAALVITPAFFGGQMTDEALIGHFRAIADASRIPVLIYNVPAYTRLSISVKAIQQLSAHSNLIGMKDSSGDVERMEMIRSAVPESFQFIMGSATAWYPALLQGVRAGILALANFAGNTCAQLQRYVETGNNEEARKLHENILPVNAATTSTYGVAGLKFASSLLGYQPGCVRSPLRELTADAKEDIKQILTKAGLI